MPLWTEEPSSPCSPRSLRLGPNRIVGYNRSGDYFIAFSTADEFRIIEQPAETKATRVLKNEEMSPLFLAAIEATEEAVYNSLFRHYRQGHR